MAHTKAYINLKIENCQRLVDNATSEDQEKVYQGYLAFWEEKLPKKERPEEIAKKAEIQAKKGEDVAAKEAEKLAVELAEADKAEKDLLEAELKAKRKADLEAQLAALEDEPMDLQLLADDFEIQNAPKKAYRIQNGVKVKTIAFKQYLNQGTQ